MIKFHRRASLLSVLLQTLLRKIYTFSDRLRWKSYYTPITHQFKSFGESVVLDYGILFGGPENISIGNNVFIGRNATINAGKGGNITIKDGVGIGAYTTIITWNLDNLGNRGLVRAENKNIFKDVVIGKGVGIGYSVTINPGIVLGDGCEIAAGSVVTRNVKPYAIMSGSPAVTVGMRQVGDEPRSLNIREHTKS
jgi:acetyltransferase-like isoleucine patch superfamily enzyme